MLREQASLDFFLQKHQQKRKRKLDVLKFGKMHISCLVHYDETTSLHYSDIKARTCIHVPPARSGETQPASVGLHPVPASYLQQPVAKIFSEAGQIALEANGNNGPRLAAVIGIMDRPG